jgi:hypothetical protein
MEESGLFRDFSMEPTGAVMKRRINYRRMIMNDESGEMGDYFDELFISRLSPGRLHKNQ